MTNCTCSGVVYHGSKSGKCSLCKAAPNLLEACKIMVCTLESYKRVLNSTGPFEIPEWVIDVPRNAIKKAEEKP